MAVEHSSTRARPGRPGGNVIALAPRRSVAEPRVIAVTSGKGGVGKSVISANLGVTYASMGRRVLLVDADLALANLDLMLGVQARVTVREILDGAASIEDAIVEGPYGVSLLAACSGDVALSELRACERMRLFDAIDSLEQRFDTLVVDTGAGVGSNATGFAAAAQQVLVVVTPDPASLADAYAMIKVLNRRCAVQRVHVVVNMAGGTGEAEQTLQRLFELVGRFLDVALVPVGTIFRDEAVGRSVRRCAPLVSVLPHASASSALRALASRMLAEAALEQSTGAPALFWKRLIGAAPSQRRQ